MYGQAWKGLVKHNLFEDAAKHAGEAMCLDLKKHQELLYNNVSPALRCVEQRD